MRIGETGMKKAAVMVNHSEWEECATLLRQIKGKHALYIKVKHGIIDFASFEMVL